MASQYPISHWSFYQDWPLLVCTFLYIYYVDVDFLLFLEYGGKWKMLHYFAKKFFGPTLISPYIDGENVTVYYISDRMRGNSLTTATKNDIPQLRYRQNGGIHSRVVPGILWHDDGHAQHHSVVRMNVSYSGVEDIHIVMGRCYKWMSFESGFEWNITFHKVTFWLVVLHGQRFSCPIVWVSVIEGDRN